MGSEPTVLVADDQPVLLRLMVRVLTRAGFRVRPASSIEEALGVLSEDPEGIDVLLLDGLLSQRIGVPTLRQLVSGRRDVGIVVSSGAELDPRLAHWLAEVGGRFLEKPFEPSGLIHAVKEVCPG